MAVNVSALLQELSKRANLIASGQTSPETSALETILAAADTSDAELLTHLAHAARAWGDHAAAELLEALAMAVREQSRLTPLDKWIWEPARLTPTPGGRKQKGRWVLVPAT